jgi:calcineurin-like phosphoesterase family protein
MIFEKNVNRDVKWVYENITLPINKRVWFTADTHFGHQRTLELSKRPFDSIEEHDRELVKLWNQTVGENDVVFHLGDFGDYGVREFLNGNIILLYGNYERDEFMNDGSAARQTLKQKYGFADVNDGVWMDIPALGDIRMVHEPGSNPGKFTLFGHIHKLQMVRHGGLNVGVDCHNFRPIDLATVNFYRNAIENHYDDYVFGDNW